MPSLDTVYPNERPEVRLGFRVSGGTIPSSGGGGGGGAPPVAGYTLWLAADSIEGLSDGDPISTWLDESGNEYNGTPFGSPTFETNEINGLPIVRCDGVSDYIVSTFNLGGTELSVFIVARFSSTTGSGLLTMHAASPAEDYSTVEAWTAYHGGGSLLQAYRDGAKSTVAWPGTATPFLFTTVFDGADNASYLDGSGASPVGSSGTFNIVATGIAARWVGGGAPTYAELSACDIAEIIIYPSALNTTDREAVELYLSTKWGI